jgi:hypothetical protein
VHGFRKFAATQMAEAEVEMEKRKIMTGHSIGVQKAYAKYKKEVLLKEHAKAWNKLSIDQSNYNVEQPEEENAQLQDEMTRQGNTLEYKYEQMTRRNDQLENQVQDMMRHLKFSLNRYSMSINGIECKPIQTITSNYVKSKSYSAESVRTGKKFEDKNDIFNVGIYH